mgnify:CR=1 FL=1
MKETKTKILVVDDDLRLRDLLRRYLIEQGFAVEAISDGSELERRLRDQPFDLVVLDLMLPGLDGLILCRNLRAAKNNTPIIMLTAKGDEVDRIIGLEMGADDYLPKPFNPRELVARIHAILRRRAMLPPGAPEAGEEVIRFGPHTLCLATRSLSHGSTTTMLSTAEFALLKILVAHPHQPMSRDALMNLSRGRDYEALDRSIDVQISRLRRLIETEPAHPKYIQTVWGYGYVFVPDAETA